MKKITFIVPVVLGVLLIFNTLDAQMNTVVSITGSVFNSITKDPVRLEYQLLDESGKIIRRGRTNAAQNGYYFVTGLKPGVKYTMKFVGDKNYFDAQFEIDIPQTDKYAEFSKDFLVPPKAKGMELPQRVPVFELNKSKLRGGAEYFLDEILILLKTNPNMKFTIIAYPDNDLNGELNKQLTQQRCESLKQFFIKNGMNANNISIEAKSNTDPNNPPPTTKRAKGKRYIGSVYYIINEF